MADGIQVVVQETEYQATITRAPKKNYASGQFSNVIRLMHILTCSATVVKKNRTKALFLANFPFMLFIPDYKHVSFELQTS